LYRIAHNLIVDTYRQQHPMASLVEATPIEAPDADVEEQILRHLASDALRHLLWCLTQDQRQVITLRFLEGYPPAEIAALMSNKRVLFVCCNIGVGRAETKSEPHR
jgi:RNA polymerase sigma-70 factor, ECF subfamily